MHTIRRLLFTAAAIALAAPAYGQPFLFSIRLLQPPTPATTFPAASLVITNARTGEVVNADDPPLLGPNEGAVAHMTTSVDGKRLYVSVGFVRPRLIIINLVTNRIDTIVPQIAGQDPWMLVADPNGRVLYGSNPLSGRITVIDAITGQVTSHVQLSNAFTTALSADGSLLAVTEPPVNTVTLLDPRTLTVRFRVTVPTAPQRVALSPDGKRAFVSCHLGASGGTIVTIDTDTGAIVNSAPTGHRPDRVLLSPSTGKVYVSFLEGGAWGVIDGTGTLAVHPAAIPSRATMAMSADGRRLYIAGVNGIIVIDTATDLPAGNLPGGSELHLAVSTPCDFILPNPRRCSTRPAGPGLSRFPRQPDVSGRCRTPRYRRA